MKIMYTIILACAIVLTTAAGLAQTAEEYSNMAMKAITVMDYSSAVKILNKGLSEDPGNFEMLLARGNVFLEMEKYDKARADFDAVLHLDSNVVDANLGLSKYYRFTNRPDSAIYFALRGVSISPDNFQRSRSKIYLAEGYRAYSRDSLALVYLREGLGDDSTNVSGYKQAADISISNGDFEAAYQYLQLANIYLLDDMENLINLAYVANMLEYNREALEYCNQALNLDPQQPLALSNRANAYLQLNQLELAEGDIQKSLTNYKSNPMAHRIAGEIYYAQGKESKACKHFRDAKKLGYTELYGDFVDTRLVSVCD
jgi:tetratricopeptide (TPR) repeat protein